MSRRVALALLALSVARAEPAVSFNQDIRPILSDNCFACHGTDAAHRKAKLRLDLPEGAYAERKGLRAIVPGDLASSEAWLRINSEYEDEVMPPPDSHKTLTPEQRALIKRWIEQGAAYQRHWSYEPIAKSVLPPAAGGAAEHPVDRFVGARLDARGLALAPEAPPEVLLRRVSLALTGLPPTVAELDAYLADRAPGAYERAVDRLLASPRYGEHIARGWLDAVRYADTHGMHLDNVRSLWPYRDWVVDAFNRNQPFDQFTLEQLAGDLLPHPTPSQRVATGYIRGNLSTAEAGTIEGEQRARDAADRTETTAAVWLGLTANCASCHDHKFDPLSQKEYYQLSAFFQSLDVPVWDGNVPIYGPHFVIGDAAQRKRLDFIAKELPRREAALSRRIDELIAANPVLIKPPKEPVTYEVIWAEDGDTPRYDTFGGPAPAGEWREDQPVAGGRRALRLEGKTDRPVLFGGPDVPLVVRTEARAFVHVRPDPAQPPRALALEFIVPGKEPTRLIWGDPKAFDGAQATSFKVAGPMPLAGTYVRLEIAATETCVDSRTAYTGIRLLQSDGVALWDRVGALYTSPDGSNDPLLSETAWRREMNRLYVAGRPGQKSNVVQPDEAPFASYIKQPSPLPLDIRYYTRLSESQQSEEEKRISPTYFRRYISGPLRGLVETEAFAARELIAELVWLENTLEATLVARERAEPRVSHVLLRGQYDQLGDPVEPATPAFLPPLAPEGKRANRLDLARWLIRPENPLTARVTVNRFWQQLFGAGLVRSPGDFGAQGIPPTHPELLDWLAADFREHGWDVKRFLRQLVTSRTFRQDSKASPALLELDPANQLLARGPRYRLDAEVLRDQALAMSGLLVPTRGGPPVRPYQPENIWEPVAFVGSNTQYYHQDHGAALYRRSLYTLVKRNAPAPAFTTFDAPSRDSFCLQRERTNTPLQALALMNDVQHLEAARALAESLLALSGGDADRLAHAFRAVTARKPDAKEQTLLAQALDKQRAHFSTRAEEAARLIAVGESTPAHQAPPEEIAAWTLVANLLMNLDETLSLN